MPDGTLMTTMEGNLEQDNLPPTDRRSSSETHYQQRTFTLISKDPGKTWRTATVAEKMGSSYSTVIEVEPNVLFVQVDGWFWRVTLNSRRDSEVRGGAPGGGTFLSPQTPRSR